MEGRTTSQPRAAQGSQFGPYKLMRTVGEGEFGKVKLSIDSRSGREVAIKLLKKDRLTTPARRSKVLREISMLQALDHPFIVSLIEVIETNSYIGLVMEYAVGGEMFHYIMAQPNGRLKEAEGRKFFAQIVAGVSYIHSMGIVHRDLKLENLLLGNNNNVLISDFGFANKNSEHLDTSCGSPGYAAPELVTNTSYVGDSADIWSCGVILYGMLCGYLPYDDDPANPESENVNLLYQYILQTKLTYPSHISSSARSIIGLMLVPDPLKRAKMPEIMSHEWLSLEAHIFQEELERRLKHFELSQKSRKRQNLENGENNQKPEGDSKSVDGRSSVKMERSGSTASKRSWFFGKRTATGPTITQIHNSRNYTGQPPSDQTMVEDSRSYRGGYSYSIVESQFSQTQTRERVLKFHSGPIDKHAMTSRDPHLLLVDLEILFQDTFGWTLESNGSRTGEFKLKVLKPNGVRLDDSKSESHSATQRLTESDFADPKLNRIVESLPITMIKKVRRFVYMMSPNASKGFDGKFDILKSKTRGISSIEEEMLFTVEIQKIRDVKGMYVVEFRRLKGDIWGFKRLYGNVIGQLPLQE